MRTAARRALALAGLAGLLLLPAASGAYTISTAQQTGKELKWTVWPMRFNIHSTAAPGLGTGPYYAAIRASYQAWTSVSCAKVTVKDEGVVNNPTGNSNDKVNTHYVPSSWNPSWGGNALGITLTYYNPNTGSISDADIAYNPGRTWSVSGKINAIDMQSVATHEIGHELGINHSSYADATMYYATGAGNTGGRSLHSDDIAAVCYQYPSGGTTPPECTKDTDCAPGEQCQNQKCVPGSTTKKGYGSPCSNNTECQSGICLKDSSKNITFCSQQCGSQSCPNNDQCYSVSTSSGTIQVCIPGSSNWGKGKLGDACQTNYDCKDNWCIPVAGKGYLCSVQCTQNPDNCTTGYYCAGYQTTSGQKYSFCVPGQKPSTGTKGLGESCTSPSDCKSGLCGTLSSGQKVCFQYCDLSKNNCPTSFKCVPITGSSQGACIKDSGSTPTKKDLGATCTQHSDCKSNICVDGGKGLVCATYCNPQSPTCQTGYTCTKLKDGKYGCIKGSGTVTPPQKGKLGDACKTSADCESNLCARDSNGNLFCTVLCDPQKGCAGGFACVSAGGGKYACTKSSGNNNNNGNNNGNPPPAESDGGCAVSPAPSGRAPAALLLLVLPLLALLRRRR